MGRLGRLFRSSVAEGGICNYGWWPGDSGAMIVVKFDVRPFESWHIAKVAMMIFSLYYRIDPIWFSNRLKANARGEHRSRPA